ncbi:unnamed protein product [Spodoptera littoralis]|uniref:MADF domain-containing protein n=1 Tax=Spodoptera littoralis TaxID=7109 RepID=A0A9P0MZ88_SPOLI|nr:unnamed protein product [Spodoptera littoralis]CAH1638839.1 unnamed protein product [Spodoptera littoralis]
MAVEIQLINEIEKHELLYNFLLPQYNRKDLVEEAWEDIAASTNMSISDCKEKWRNIRSSFLRSMKQCGTKIKKPYYLTEYLRFIVPYLKPTVSGIESADETQYHSPQHANEPETLIIKTEPIDDNDENQEESNDNVILSDLLRQRPAVTRKRRRFIPVKKPYADLRPRSKPMTSLERNANNDLNPNNNAMKMFLLSLLPEIDTMTEDQRRLFKIKTMMLIDEIKVNYDQVRQATSSINGERLQKRLINLLLKNLQKSPKENSKSK